MVRHPEDPFRILVLGDFSGRAPKENSRRASQPLRIDRDNFDVVMEKIGVRLSSLDVDPNLEPQDLPFRVLDDFHPDHLFSQLAVFSKLRDLRERLDDDRSFEAAAQELQSWLTPTSAAPEIQVSANNCNTTVTSESILDSVLESSAAQVDVDSASWTSLIQKIAAPHAIPSIGRRQSEMLSYIDSLISSTMTSVLHTPKFRFLESAWRGLAKLVYDLETSPELKIYVLDISQEQLRNDLEHPEGLESSQLYNELVEQTVGIAGSERWSLLLANYAFGTGQEDITCLSQISRIATAADASLVSMIVDVNGRESREPDFERLLTDLEQSQAWEEFRNNEGAAGTVIVWPEFLLRLPYGTATKPIEAFQYEEVANCPQDLLWGNAAFLVAQMMGELFGSYGWEIPVGQRYEFADLPLWIKEDAGNTHIHPCGRMLISDRQAQRLKSIGINPIVSVRDQAEVMLLGCTSTAGTGWIGPWSR
ncbi:MAG: type VI secretion system contractile sheath large subunit [Planctomycetales bacterium]|nr:type VI secretion system contractile sheath large subunit [Planctomycetales bacterium]